MNDDELVYCGQMDLSAGVEHITSCVLVDQHDGWHKDADGYRWPHPEG